MKRRPDTELNADNYDSWVNQESDQPRSSGAPRQADDSILSKRVIIKAKRKGFNTNSERTNAFGSVNTKSSSNPFSFGSKAAASVTSTNNTNVIQNTNFNFNSVKSISSSQMSTNSSGDGNKNKKMRIPPAEQDDNTKDEKFTKSVGKLNQKFLKSIKDFISSNSCIDLKPCFESYNKHFLHIIETYGTESVVLNIHNSGTRDLSNVCKQLNINLSSSEDGSDNENGNGKRINIETEKEEMTTSQDSQKTVILAKEPEITIPKKSVISLNAEPIKKEKISEPETVIPKASPFQFKPIDSNAPKPSFSFGKVASTNLASSSTPFTFGLASTSKQDTSTSNNPSNTSLAPSTNLFSGSLFGSTSKNTENSTPFSFNFAQKKPDEPKSEPKSEPVKEGEPNDTVPEVKEKKFETENVVLEQRCKLYFNSGTDGYKERGVGTFYIKEDPDTKKGQILIRAENSTGTVLLNAAIYKNMPIKKQGKNNIIIMCNVQPEIPKYTELTNKMCSFLFKVKGEDMVEALIAKLNEYI